MFSLTKKKKITSRYTKHIFAIDIKSRNLTCILIIKLIMFKLKQEGYLLVEIL